MKKSKLFNFILWIIGFILAELWRRLLKNIHIHEFFKWFTGIAIIIFIFFIISKITSLLNKEKFTLKGLFNINISKLSSILYLLFILN